jgi:hypothetical protein
MTFAQARLDVYAMAKNAGEDYYSLSYTETHARGKLHDTQCRVYVNQYGMHDAATWADAIAQLRAAMGDACLPKPASDEAPEVDA